LGHFRYPQALDSVGQRVVVGEANQLFGAAGVRGGAQADPRLRISLAAGQVAVSWPYSSSGWMLEQNDNLTTSNRTAFAGGVSNDRANNFMILNPSQGHRFYPLVTPSPTSMDSSPPRTASSPR
jgi:hypothetical protein